MKLFGNSRHPAHSKEVGTGKSGRHLSGVQKGLLLLFGSVLVLCLSVLGICKHFVRPMELPVTKLPSESEEEMFTPPTTTQIQIQVNEETGEEVEVEVAVPASHKQGFYNILIVGTDDDGLRTDTIIIARLDTNDHSVAMLSVPRDTLVGTAGVNKINSVYGNNGKNEKGMEALKKSLARLLGFEVDGYALVDLDAFVQLVDLVGGVEFDVPQNMYYNDPSQDLYINLQAGKQMLDGEKAMQLVRFRGYAMADIQRTHVQQEFLTALAKKCLNIGNLRKIGSMATIFSENVLTDLSVGNIAYFGQELLKCDFDQMYTYTLEGEGFRMENGMDVWALYLHKTLDVVNEYFNPYDAEITASNVTFRSPEYLKQYQASQAETVPAEEEPAPEETVDEEISEELPEEELPEEELPEEEGTEEELPDEPAPEEETAEDLPVEEPDWDDPLG